MAARLKRLLLSPWQSGGRKKGHWCLAGFLLSMQFTEPRPQERRHEHSGCFCPHQSPIDMRSGLCQWLFQIP